jgi:SAM-dependent methyltransferase
LNEDVTPWIIAGHDDAGPGTGDMRADAKQIFLNVMAGTPALSALRRVRDLLRPADYEAIAAAVLDRFRIRREVIGDDRIRGASLLEIGSGREFGLALLLVGMGARRVVNVEIDRYRFIDDLAFYRLLVERARAAGCEVRWPPDGVGAIEGRRVRPDGERIAVHLGQSAASLSEGDAAFDVTFSVSVLQHVRRGDVPAVARELHRVTRPGGRGYHRVDFTDMESVNPFLHLCYDEDAYAAMYGRRFSYTNRYRMDDLDRIFRAAGFEEVRFEDVRLHDDRALFEATRPGFSPEFAGRPTDLLLARSCMLVLRRAAS